MNKNLLDSLKQNRFSAVVDGICLGFGFVFIIFGIFLPMVLHAQNQTINGLLAVIGGILLTATGGIMEVYHWARLPLTCEQDIESKRWFGLILRCKDCGERTGHVLIKSVNLKTGEIEKTYECMQCGETKRIYETSSPAKSANAQGPMVSAT